jgi:DNA modification methylase
METRLVSIGQVKPNENNPRIIKDYKFKKLVKSIQDFPQMLQLRPIVVNEDNVVLGGNMRLKACKEAGLKEVYIIQAKDLTEEQQREFIVKDNVGFGEWDWDILANEWDVAQLEDWGLDGFPFEEEVLEAKEDDYTEPDKIKVDVVLGDLIEIGEHRLLCGDSTDSDQVAKLMNGEKAELLFTSPPYNLGKSVGLRNGAFKGKDNAYDVYEDDQTEEDYLSLLKDFHSTSMIYSDVQAINIQSLTNNKVSLIEWLNHFKNHFIDVLIWNKTNPAPAMAEKVVSSAFEFVYLFDSNQNPKRSIRTANFERGKMSNVYTSSVGNNSHTEGSHGATFPIPLASHYLSNLSHQYSIIYDSFLGSGTTMVAAHQLKRKCYGMELDPKYCQVIIDRMHKLDSSLIIKINGQEYTTNVND